MIKTNKIKELLSHLRKVRKIREGNKYMALCPAHDDKNPSLSITVKNKKILLHCHAGCETKDILSEIGLDFSDLSLKNQSSNVGHRIRKSTQHRNSGCSLEEYSEYKEIPVDFLEDLGLSEKKYKGSYSLVIPYMDEDGNTVSYRYRTGLSGADNFRWEKGANMILYGLWKLKEAREKGYVVLVEGESDCHTLWFNGFPAIGVPGASTWKEEWAAHYFQDVPKLYVVIEPDKGGGILLGALKKSELNNRIKTLNLGKFKDPSGLYLSAPGRFKQNFEEALSSAIPLKALLSKERKKIRQKAWEECKDIALNEDILGLFIKDLSKMGVVGESKLSKFLYLGVTTRLLEDPVCALIKGPSSTGKSYVPDKVLQFFPSSAYYNLTTSSEKTLIYTEESLKHRFIIYYELAGIKGGREGSQDYLIRSLISEKRIDYEYVEASKGKPFKTRRVTKEGPTGFITTTTRVNINPENETRFLSFNTNDSSEQTGKILSKEAEIGIEGSQGKGMDLNKWRAFQTWLEKAVKPVVIPFASQLAKLVDHEAPRIRRDFKKLLELIRANALIQQKHREEDPKGRIVATLEDYEIVRKIVVDAISSGVEATVPKEIRETVMKVREMIGRKSKSDKSVSITEVAKELGIHKSTAKHRIDTAKSKGYLQNLEDKRGRPARIEIGDPMPSDKQVLPAVSVLRKAYEGRKKVRRIRK
jgi:hypothetical protein